VSHSFRVSEETYRALSRAAARHGQSPEGLFTAWVEEQEVKDRHAEHPDGVRSGDQVPEDDPLGPFLGTFEATEPDVVRRHDDYLAESYTGRDGARS